MNDDDGLQSPRCPGCLSEPAFVLDDGHQAFCDTDGCTVIMWDMWVHPETLLADAETIDLPPELS